MNLSFIIPCLNSEKIIRKSINKLVNKLNQKKIIHELIIINDGSVDKTLEELKKIKNKNIRIISNSKNLGKSTSLIKGIKLSKYKKIILIDCDMPYFEYLDKLISLLKNNDFVYINRRSLKSKVSSKDLNFYQICRQYIGSTICFFLNLFLLDRNVGDTQAGLKGFSKPKNFNKIRFLSSKFFFDAEIMVLFYRSKIKLKPIILKYKIYKESSIKLFAIENFIYLFELIKVIVHYLFERKKRIYL